MQNTMATLLQGDIGQPLEPQALLLVSLLFSHILARHLLEGNVRNTSTSFNLKRISLVWIFERLIRSL